MVTLNRDYVLAPFHALMTNCQSNALMGLRIAEKLERFPEPTPEELRFIQLSFAGHIQGLEEARTRFKKWILIKGFEDIHNCIRTTLERLLVFKQIEQKIMTNANLDVAEFEEDSRKIAGALSTQTSSCVGSA